MTTYIEPLRPSLQRFQSSKFPDR